MKKGFTLVELLAVIVILAVILIIAIPKISNVIDASKLSSFTDSAKIIASQIDKQRMINKINKVTSAITCSDVSSYNSSDYRSCTVGSVDSNGNTSITLVGAGKFEGLRCRGTSINMNCTNSSTSNEETVYVVSKKEMSIGQPIPEGVNARSTAQEAMADWANIGPGVIRPFYLKLTIEKGGEIIQGWQICSTSDGEDCSPPYDSESECTEVIENAIEAGYINEGDYECSSIIATDPIIEGYVEFVVTPEMAQANEGMTAGTYSLRGGVDESLLTTKPIYEANKEVLKTAFNYTNYPGRCGESSSNGDFYCSVLGLRVDMFEYGRVTVETTGNPNFLCAGGGGGFGCFPSGVS